MKKGKIIIICLLMLGIGAGLLLINKVGQKKDEEIQITKIPTEVHNGTLKGQVADAAMNTIVVRDQNNREYIIARDDEKTSGDSLLNGDTITIQYTGTLKDNKSQIQDITIKSIVLKAQVVKNANTTNDADDHENDTQVTQTSRVAQIYSAMTLKEKIEQMFFVRVPDQGALSLVKQDQMGGYILFGPDFKGKSVAQVQKTIASYQKSSKVPMLIGTDEEGGSVVRASAYLRSTRFQSPQTLYKTGGFAAITQDTKVKSAFLQNLGVNVNFAPVCDVSTNAKDFINGRSFGKNATQTSRYVTTVVEAMHTAKEGSVLKHFPGYGNNADTHTNICYDHRSYSTFLNSDFKPFEAGIKAGADSILVSHNIVASIDNTNPSSLSPAIHKIIRNKLHYHGVVMTDDLLMEGVRKLDSDEHIAVKAVIAGNDMLLSSNPKVQIAAVIKAVHDGYISENQIDQSVMRILTWKEEIGLLK